jgi:hypothetical protein
VELVAAGGGVSVVGEGVEGADSVDGCAAAAGSFEIGIEASGMLIWKVMVSLWKTIGTLLDSITIETAASAKIVKSSFSIRFAALK